MKVNKSIYMGDDTLRARHEEKNGVKKSAGSQTINGSSVMAKLDPITEKRKAAQKKAMKIVGDVFSNDRKIDDDLEARHDRIKSLQKDLGAANKAIREIEEERSALRDSYGVGADSKEEKDLQLLEKEMRSNMPGSDVRLTDEERDAIEEIKKGGLTEYQQRSLDLLKSEEPYAAAAYEAENEIKTENRVITATKIERLKTHAMTDAEKQAGEIMDAASKEIIGMLVDEAKDHIDEEAKKREEQAKAEKEKQEEQQERIDAAKERKKENEELTEDILESTRELANQSSDLNAAQQEIKDMMNKMKLIEDDIKGAEVDKKA